MGTVYVEHAYNSDEDIQQHGINVNTFYNGKWREVWIYPDSFNETQLGREIVEALQRLPVKTSEVQIEIYEGLDGGAMEPLEYDVEMYLSNYEDDLVIKVGCQEYPLETWRKAFEAIAESNSFDDKESIIDLLNPLIQWFGKTSINYIEDGVGTFKYDELEESAKENAMEYMRERESEVEWWGAAYDEIAKLFKIMGFTIPNDTDLWEHEESGHCEGFNFWFNGDIHYSLPRYGEPVFTAWLQKIDSNFAGSLRARLLSPLEEIQKLHERWGDFGFYAVNTHREVMTVALNNFPSNEYRGDDIEDVCRWFTRQLIYEAEEILFTHYKSHMDERAIAERCQDLEWDFNGDTA